jgi:hypothetical protein
VKDGAACAACGAAAKAIPNPPAIIADMIANIFLIAFFSPP